MRRRYGLDNSRWEFPQIGRKLYECKKEKKQLDHQLNQFKLLTQTGHFLKYISNLLV